MNQKEINPLISEVGFSRAAPQKAIRVKTIKPYQAILLAAILLLGMVGWTIFTSKAVKFDIRPTAENINIEGTFPAWELGGRYLMQSGTYRVTATSQGYYDLDESIDVGDETDQQFSFNMKMLPGVLSVHSDPETDGQLIIDGSEAGNLPMLMEQLDPGPHEIRILTSRFQPWGSSLVVEGRQIEQSLRAELIPAWAMIDIVSSPPGATIEVADQVLGTTPATVELIEGARTITLRLDGYKTHHDDIVVIAGNDQMLSPVNLVKADGTLVVSSQPGQASLTVDGTYRGVTPLEIKLPPGKSYQLSVSKAGYQPLNQPIAIKANQDIELNLNLTPLIGQIRLVTEPVESELLIDGKAAGSANQILSLVARSHHLIVRKQGYEDWVSDVTPRPGFAQQVDIHLKTLAQASLDAIPKNLYSSMGQELKYIQPGPLSMGAPRREPGRRSNEIEKTVQLSQAFYMGSTEVTNQQYLAFDPTHSSGMISRILLDQPDRPVVNVSWHEAVGFCNWLSEKDGLDPTYEQIKGDWKLLDPMRNGYRLPSEAEWVYAARFAANKMVTRFPWGDSMPPAAESGNYADESGKNLVSYSIKGYNDHFRGTAPVASFTENSVGLFDMGGNVAEWVNDYYSTKPARAGQILLDPLGPKTGNTRVIRGSSFLQGRFSELRWTYRDFGTNARADVGFRITRSHLASIGQQPGELGSASTEQ